ncbi:MAG: ABC transporter permease [Dehalococcoidia bacterium]
MSIWESIKTAVGTIMASKLRAGLTMLGIVIGVFAVTLLVSLGQGFQSGVTNIFASMGANAFYVLSSPDKTLNSVRPLTVDDANALIDKDLAPDIAVVSPTLSRNVTVHYGKNSSYVPATGVYPVITQIRTFTQDQGRFINDQDVASRDRVCELGWQTEQDLFNGQDAVGQSVRVHGEKYKVIGTIQKMGGPQGDGYILIPLSTMHADITGGINVQSIAVLATSPDQVDNAINEVTAILNVRHYIRPAASSDFAIRDMRQILQTMMATLAGFALFMSAIGAISLVVGGIGIMNIMLVSVSERTREIGLRKAIGARHRDILLQFLIESSLLSLMGGLIGLVLAVVATSTMGQVTLGRATFVPQIPAGIVIIALGVSIGTGLLSGTYPAYRAAQLDPIESLRHE